MIDIHPEHARTVLGELAVGIVLLDRAERINWVNGYAADLLGAQPEALTGRAIDELDVPYTALRPGDDPQVRADGALIGITQGYRHSMSDGSLLMLFDRGHTLVWFLSALSSGLPATVATSGILTRQTITSRLEAEVSRSRRYSNPLSCITVAAEGASPLAVTDIARLLKGQLRWVDVLGQWSEDTLLVILPETDDEAVTGLAGKLTEAMANKQFHGMPTVAIGCAAWIRGDSAEQLVERAIASADPGSQVLPFNRLADPG